LENLPYLHGIPISVKELLEMKGMRTTVGCAMNEYIGKVDSPCITPIIEEGGAIPLVRGNVPQGALSVHSENYIWGTAKNPHQNSRSCGGSSGGDAGLVAAGCVPLGIGTDLASSIRIPATFNGVTGFKPTQSRFTHRNMIHAKKARTDIGNEFFSPISGPLCNSAKDATEYFRLMCVDDAHLRDPFKPPQKFNEEYLQKVQNPN
jgi:Asp-tRNA(Asn)/Glu-tRNA(Gln) amidotransferase A subunit family amidase